MGLGERETNTSIKIIDVNIFVDEINDLIISLTEGNPQLIDRLWQYSTDEFYTYLKTIKRVFPDKLLKQREQLVVEQ